MANYTAADVKRLREETDAPMLECKNALEEAEGNYERAKEILREKGKAAAAKRAGRSTSAGVVAISKSDDGKTVGAVVLESETDFVAKNEDFIKIAQQIADMYRDSDPGGDPLAVSSNGKTVKDLVEEAIGKIRENIQVTQAVHLQSSEPLSIYVHHDKMKGAIVEAEGDNAGSEAVRKVAIQVVSNPPQVVAKEDLSQEMLDKEMEIEMQRAINEGKPENIARNIAQGRVNKEYIKQAVLLEQPFYVDQSKSVSQYLGEEAEGAKIKRFVHLAVGKNS